MSRRTLDIVFSAGGAVLAVLLLILGFVLADQGSFAKSYVKDELGQQKITFATTDKLTDEEKSWKPGSACLTDYAGKLMETGKQAECYANFYIGLHLENAATTAGFPGETYATLGAIRTQLTADVAAAKAKNDTEGAAAAQKKLDSATSLRSTAQTGETLRGLLLTSYGFSIFGEKASQVAIVAYIIGAVLLLLAVAGFVHAFVTAPDKLVGVPEGYKLTPPAGAPGATPTPST